MPVYKSNNILKPPVGNLKTSNQLKLCSPLIHSETTKDHLFNNYVAENEYPSYHTKIALHSAFYILLSHLTLYEILASRPN
jgi:hypothetical protein